MFFVKCGCNSKSIKLVTNVYSLNKYNSLLPKDYIPVAHLYTIKSNYDKYHNFITTNDKDKTCRIISSKNYLKYSTKYEELPPLPPPPSESDIFGSIGGLKYEKVALDADELKEEERLKDIGRRVPRKFKPTAGQYAKIIKSYVEKGDLASAENVIDQCKQNKDKPTPYMFTLLMRAFAVQGDIVKCYKYFSEMKTRHYKIKENVYTSLFNACANSPDSEKALNYLERAKNHMAKQKFSMNHAHYNCMVKVYGRHNQMEKANKLLEEMMKKKMKIGITTLNSLMYAANSNTESGLKQVLQTWQLMRKLQVPPDVFSYHLILRAIRETHFGDCTVNDLLLSNEEYPLIIAENSRPDLLMYPPLLSSSLPMDNIQIKNSPNDVKLLNAPQSESPQSSTSELNSTKSEPLEEDLEPLPPSIANLNLDAVLKQNKLILFGGLDGFIEKMKCDKVEPTVKTVTYLMELVPDSVAAEASVIKLAKSHKIQLDIDFYNMLIKKRALRGAKKEAKEVLEDIHKEDLKPNIITYGVLALACDSIKECRELLQAMKCTYHTINKYVADTILNTAFAKKDFLFILEVMELLKKERVRLDESTFEKFEEFQKRMTELVKTKHKSASKDAFKIGFSKFNMRFKTWQKDMGRKIMTENEAKS